MLLLNNYRYFLKCTDIIVSIALVVSHRHLFCAFWILGIYSQVFNACQISHFQGHTSDQSSPTCCNWNTVDKGCIWKKCTHKHVCLKCTGDYPVFKCTGVSSITHSQYKCSVSSKSRHSHSVLPPRYKTCIGSNCPMQTQWIKWVPDKVTVC